MNSACASAHAFTTGQVVMLDAAIILAMVAIAVGLGFAIDAWISR